MTLLQPRQSLDEACPYDRVASEKRRGARDTTWDNECGDQHLGSNDVFRWETFLGIEHESDQARSRHLQVGNIVDVNLWCSEGVDEGHALPLYRCECGSNATPTRGYNFCDMREALRCSAENEVENPATQGCDRQRVATIEASGPLFWRAIANRRPAA